VHVFPFAPEDAREMKPFLYKYTRKSVPFPDDKTVNSAG